MTTTVEITCDGNGCTAAISNEANGSTDDVSQLMEWHKWRNDPTTDQYQYCPRCWPAVRAEYAQMHANGELSQGA